MMSSGKNRFDVSGRAMGAQMIRLNTVASNLANSNNISSTSESAYRPLKPIFRTIYSDKLHDNGIATVDAVNVKELNREPEKVLCQITQKLMKTDIYSMPLST